MDPRQEKWDGMLLHLAQENQGIDRLMDTFFGFLYRKTDFFSAATNESSKNKVLEVYNKWAETQNKKEADKQKLLAEKSKYNAEIQKKIDAANKVPKQTSKIMEVTDEEAAAIKKAKTEVQAATETSAQPAAAAASTEKKPSSAAGDASSSKQPGKISDIYEPSPFDEKDGEDDENFDPKLLKPNRCNGANMEKYSWTQTLKEVEIRIPFQAWLYEGIGFLKV